MSRATFVLLTIIGFPAICTAQSNSCPAPRNGCQAPDSCYYCPPQYPPSPEAGQPPGAPEAGAFVVPPPTGEVQGESRSMGLRLGTLRIPEINIPLPTFQLPSLVRFRRDAEMITSAAHAPFIGAQEAGQLELRPGAPEAGEPLPPPGAPEAGQPTYQRPHCVPYCPPACEAPRGCASTDVQRLEQQVAQLQGLVEQLAILQMQQNGNPADGVQQSTFQQPAQQPEAIATPAAQPTTTAPVAMPFEIIEDTTRPHPGSQPAAAADAQRQAERQRQAELERRAESLRQAELQRQTAQYNEKCQEVDELRTQVAEMQRQYQLMLELQQSQVFRQREERLRGQLNGQPTQPAAAIRPARPTHQARPMPAPFPAPVERRPNTASADGSAFDDHASGQASYSWQTQSTATEAGVVRLSNLSR